MNHPVNHEIAAQMGSDATVLEQMRKTIAIVAHDLKTPLTGVKLFADILLSHGDDLDGATRSKYLAVISSEAERMSRMIANIVDYQNISNATAEWRDEESDIVALIDRCVRPLQRWCTAKGIDFSYVADVERLVMAVDAERFLRLLSGLLVNAMRFTESGGVELKLRSDGATVSLAVSDSGPGIPAERLQQLFPAHLGMVNLDKDVGLAFARAVVGHYRGRIWAESVVGNGATFYVELPLRQ
jgi:signal transduction histidine kinase